MSTAEEGCPQYWADHAVRCVFHKGHEGPCVFRHPTGATFVSSREWRDALLRVASYSDHGREGDRARRLIAQLDKAT